MSRHAIVVTRFDQRTISFTVVRKLDSLEAWRHGRQLSRDAYRLTLATPLSRHFSLADQIRRAAASIPANVAEGYAPPQRRSSCAVSAWHSDRQLNC